MAGFAPVEHFVQNTVFDGVDLNGFERTIVMHAAGELQLLFAYAWIREESLVRYAPV